jgi:ribonuclease P protein component
LRKSKKLSLPIKDLSNTFHKQERLCSKKQMDLLFEKGKSQTAYPIKAVYLETPVDLKHPVQAMFVVPKRQFKRAHDRNKLKRRMREAYRLNKKKAYDTLLLKDKKMILAFIYIGKKAEEYSVIERALIKQLAIII